MDENPLREFMVFQVLGKINVKYEFLYRQMQIPFFSFTGV